MSTNPTDRLSEVTEAIKRLLTADERNERSSRPPSHWVHGSDEGADWCPECCAKEVARLVAAGEDVCVDGGWGSDCDSRPTCEGCGRALDETLTAYGCHEEASHYETCGPPDIDLLDALESFYPDPKYPTLGDRLLVLAEALLADLQADPARVKQETT